MGSGSWGQGTWGLTVALQLVAVAPGGSRPLRSRSLVLEVVGLVRLSLWSAVPDSESMVGAETAGVGAGRGPCAGGGQRPSTDDQTLVCDHLLPQRRKTTDLLISLSPHHSSFQNFGNVWFFHSSPHASTGGVGGAVLEFPGSSTVLSPPPLNFSKGCPELSPGRTGQ